MSYTRSVAGLFGPPPMKRLLDITLGLIGLLGALPLMGVIAALVKLSSPGPVLFRQVRVGRNGKDFVVLKFRTMTAVPGAEQGRFEPGNTRRVTRFGRFLRAAKLDELPQLFNVLAGDMALVGPRPEVRRWVEAYPERWAGVLAVKPGLTDPASVYYRHEERILAASADPERTYHETILPRKLDLYEQYVAHPSCWNDLKILARTVLVILRPQPTRQE
jgi:lipopolysaccharide/colanic/teichoic acid biosynthesis glycosyltransferase